ncbi:MAG: L-rhamnose mutarotase [Candidatus Hydrogenedentes bacterium]|nr:L-rhamnose mutarotase [Candidatus Hydrogenedentota bacterium]
MERRGFVMQLMPGYEAEYKRRHDALWPELAQLLKEAGISDYVIYLDPASGRLFGSLKLAEGHGADGLPEHPVMQKWWAYMADIMETNPDHSPAQVGLEEVFYLA